MQPIANHLPMRVTRVLNKQDINVLNQIKVNNKDDGSVSVKMSNKLLGHEANVIPLPNGLLEVSYKDPLERLIEVNSDGICANVKMCNW